MSMRQTLLLFSMLMSFFVSAKENEVIDSIDVGTGVVYYADFTQVTDTICADSIDSVNPPIPQIPLEECDSLMARDVTDHYGVVYKDGKCGIYESH